MMFCFFGFIVCFPCFATKYKSFLNILFRLKVNESILAGHLQPAPETAYRLAAILAQVV